MMEISKIQELDYTAGLDFTSEQYVFLTNAQSNSGKGTKGIESLEMYFDNLLGREGLRNNEQGGLELNLMSSMYALMDPESLNVDLEDGSFESGLRLHLGMAETQNFQIYYKKGGGLLSILFPWGDFLIVGSKGHQGGSNQLQKEIYLMYGRKKDEEPYSVMVLKTKEMKRSTDSENPFGEGVSFLVDSEKQTYIKGMEGNLTGNISEMINFLKEEHNRNRT